MKHVGRTDVAGTMLVLVLALSPALAYDASDMCLSCHEKTLVPVTPHPMFEQIAGRTASEPTDLPLDSGKVTCMTCHRGHGPNPVHKEGAEAFNLRLPVLELCARCHTAADGTWDKSHARYAESIHGGQRMAPLGVAAPADARDHDVASNRCLDCHGAGAAREPGITRPVPIDSVSSHPLVEYAQDGRGSYRPREELDKAIRLIDGRVSCVSCHRMYGHLGKHRFAIASNRAQLCLTCHDLGAQVAGM